MIIDGVPLPPVAKRSAKTSLFKARMPRRLLKACGRLLIFREADGALALAMDNEDLRDTLDRLQKNTRELCAADARMLICAIAHLLLGMWSTL